MAVTVHYMSFGPDGNLQMNSHLAAFRALRGSHTGENLASEMFNVLRDLNILDRVSNYVSFIFING